MLSQSFRAWLAAAITAIQISLAPVGATASQLVNFITDPLNVSYTFSEQDIDTYFDKSVIQIVPDGTTIDGALYDDVWLSHDASEIFRTNAFDFQSAYSIASNTSGTFVSGSGFFDSVPIFASSSSSQLGYSQKFTIPYTIGSYYISPNYSVDVVRGYYDYQRNVLLNTPSGSISLGTNLSDSSPWPYTFQFRNFNGEISSYFLDRNSTLSASPQTLGSFVSAPFDFDYVSGTIPAEPLADDEGIVLHVPSDHPDNTLHQFLIDNPDYGQPGGKTIDVSLPDFDVDLDDLADILIPLIPVINSDFSTEINPVSPVPGEGTIAETQYSVLESILERIKLSIDNLAPLISSIPSAISTAASDVIEAISSIPSAISSLGDRLLQDIEQGPIRVFDKVLDVFRTVFAPVINLITSGLGIWHYVLEWLSTISAPFTFILSVLPSGVMVPIYASVAGFLVIAIWRRFGK